MTEEWEHIDREDIKVNEKFQTKNIIPLRK